MWRASPFANRTVESRKKGNKQADLYPLSLVILLPLDSTLNLTLIRTIQPQLSTTYQSTGSTTPSVSTSRPVSSVTSEPRGTLDPTPPWSRSRELRTRRLLSFTSERWVLGWPRDRVFFWICSFKRSSGRSERGVWKELAKAKSGEVLIGIWGISRIEVRSPYTTGRWLGRDSQTATPVRDGLQFARREEESGIRSLLAKRNNLDGRKHQIVLANPSGSPTERASWEDLDL
jgi:hypothetical protein